MSESGADRRFHVGVAIGALLLMVLVVWLTTDEDFEAALPPLPPKPAAADPSLVRNTDYTREMFAAYVAKDAESYGIAAPDPARLDDPFAYELSQPRQALAPGAPAFETRALRISVQVEPLTAQTSRGSYQAEHLIVAIENRTDHFLAYRVVTHPGLEQPRCLIKQDLPHNAVALRPREKLERTECIYRNGQKPVLESVESLVIPELAYYQTSRLYPPHIGLDQRTSRGHKPPKGSACTHIPEQAIRMGLQKGQVSWRDILDFYSRHRCDTYMFPVGYRAFEKKGERSLPVSPRDVTPPG